MVFHSIRIVFKFDREKSKFKNEIVNTGAEQINHDFKTGIALPHSGAPLRPKKTKTMNI